MGCFIVVLAFSGFFIVFALVTWIIEKARCVRETRKYSTKLRKIKPQLDKINLLEISKQYHTVRIEYLKMQEFLPRTFGIDQPKENTYSINYYTKREAAYRRQIRRIRKQRRR